MTEPDYCHNCGGEGWADGQECPACDGSGKSLGPVTRPARPILDDDDVGEIIDALGTLAGTYADRGLPYGRTARLQARLIEARPFLRQALAGLAPAATLTEE